MLVWLLFFSPASHPFENLVPSFPAGWCVWEAAAVDRMLLLKLLLPVCAWRAVCHLRADKKKLDVLPQMAVPLPEKSELMASWAKENFYWPHAALQEAVQNSEGARKERAVSRSLLYQLFFGRNSNLLPL